MLDLGRIVYLDAQKTASTFLSDFLAIHSGLDVVYFQKHAPITEQQLQRDPVSFLISVRRPGPYYLSLFNYGLDGRGEIFQKFSRSGQLDLYQPKESSFRRFMDAINDGHVYGLQTRRLLRIMNLDSPTFLPGETNQASDFRLEDFIRTEELTWDLARRRCEWAGFARLAKLVENRPRLIWSEATSRMQSALGFAQPRWKHGVNRNRSNGAFETSRFFMDSLDSPDGPLGELEEPIFNIYQRMTCQVRSRGL